MTVPFYLFITVFTMLVVLLIWQQVSHILAMRFKNAELTDLHNRLMARDLQEYAGATRALGAKPGKKKDNTDEFTEQEKERALDRIPIN